MPKDFRYKDIKDDIGDSYYKDRQEERDWDYWSEKFHQEEELDRYCDEQKQLYWFKLIQRHWKKIFKYNNRTIKGLLYLYKK